MPSVVLTLQKLLLAGSDVFYALNDLHTEDLGKTWSPTTEHADTLGRRSEPDDVIVAACDFTPKWHAATGKLLGTGHTGSSVACQSWHGVSDKKSAGSDEY